MNSNIEMNCIQAEASIFDAATRLDQCKIKLLVVVDSDRKLLGTISDGDIRRGILHGKTTADQLSGIMYTEPLVRRVGEDYSSVLPEMEGRVLRYLPLIDEQGRVDSIVSFEKIDSLSPHDNLIVLMAGGLGSRLMPLTKNCPKPMLRIGDCPVLETIISNFYDQGFRNFAISVNHQSEQIVEHFGDGSALGINIQYIHEDHPRGTAGALALIKDHPNKPIIVMNGDLLTKVNLQHLLSFHRTHGSKMVVCVREHQYQLAYGVVQHEGYMVTGIEEKPTQSFFANAGIYLLEPDVIKQIPAEGRTDFPSLIQSLIAQNHQVSAFPIHEYWIDIGNHDDFKRAKQDFDIHFTSKTQAP